jgi:hypothetical protein
MTAPKDETAKVDTSKLVRPNEDSAKESTPIHDEVLAGQQVDVDHLEGFDEADITHFEEDDDPQSLAGEEIKDEN